QPPPVPPSGAPRRALPGPGLGCGRGAAVAPVRSETGHARDDSGRFLARVLDGSSISPMTRGRDDAPTLPPAQPHPPPGRAPLNPSSARAIMARPPGALRSAAHGSRTHRRDGRDVASMRYIGNKTRLLGFIRRVLRARGIEPGSAVDPFTGTASVASELKRLGFRVVASDIMEYAYVFGRAYVEVAAEPSFDGLAPEIGSAAKGLD